MKTLINQNRFIKAVEYLSEHVFSKPYSITPVIERWFNQYARVLLSDGQIVSVGDSTELEDGTITNDFIQITLDGTIVPRADILLVEKFKSSNTYFKFDEERAKLVEKIEVLKASALIQQNKLKAIPEATTKATRKTRAARVTPIQVAIKSLKEEEEQAIKELAQLNADKEKADKLYENIVARGKTSINEELLEKEYGKKIKKIIYRPNHDLTHSVRAAYFIIATHAYRKEHNTAFMDLSDSELEKLQMIMLFSVVGRQDETGFGDGGLSRKTYEHFRATSGREYLKYFQMNKKIYGGDLELLYRDAIIVELMGYSSIDDLLLRRTTPPEVFIDYVIAKERSLGRKVDRESALLLINDDTYSINALFPPDSAERALASSKLEMMNDAHAADLIRCYPLVVEYSDKDLASPNMIKDLNYLLSLSEFYTPDSPNLQKLTSFYTMMRCGFDAMVITGESTTYGLLSVEEFEKQKPEIIKKINAEFEKFIVSPRTWDLLIKEGREKIKEINFYFGEKSGLRIWTDDEIYKRYRQYCILKLTATCLTSGIPALKSTKEFFSFQHSVDGDPHKMDYHKNATSIVHAIQAIQPISGITPTLAQIIPAVKHAKDAGGKITVLFDIREEALQFIETCTELLGVTPTIDVNKETFDVQIDKKHYNQLIKDELIVLRLPIITAIIHERDVHDKLTGKVTAIFDDHKQAIHFKTTFIDQFSDETPPVISQKEGKYHIQVDRKKYKQLVKDQLVEFKLVTIPKKVSREDTLIDENGTVEALNLVARNRAVVRLVSTTALNGEDFPDYEYYFNSLEDPIKAKNRYSQKPGEDSIHDWYSDPRSTERYQRIVSDKPLPPARLQEPIDRPLRFKDKLEEGWIVGSPEGDRNTKFAKKTAHSLLPSHGKMIPFKGYADKQGNYFPIGILSDREQVDMKDERYVWSKNMVTWQRFWIKDPSTANRHLYEACGAKWDITTKEIIRDKSGKVVITKTSVEKLKSIRRYLKGYDDEQGNHINGKVGKIIELLDETHFRPTDKVLAEIKSLILEERDEILKRNSITSSPDAEMEIKKLYDQLLARVDQEAARTHPKYAISIRQLIEHQNKTTNAEEHNEILLSNTKGAVRSLYATQDTLFDRLNLAFQAMKIKEKYHYDVPLIITNQEKPPYTYTEAMVIADLQEAYKKLLENDFPYDQTLFDSWKWDEEAGCAVQQFNAKGKPLQEPKNKEYQQKLLLDLFKLGLPKLQTLDQLVQGDYSGIKLDKKVIDGTIESIIKRMDMIGGLARENTLMNNIFTASNIANRENFFLRTAALGHPIIMEKILASASFTITDLLFEKAIQFAEKNNQLAMKNFLLSSEKAIKKIVPSKKPSGLKTFFISELENLRKPIVGSDLENMLEVYQQRISKITDLHLPLLEECSLDSSQLALLQQTTEEVLLNASSKTVTNTQDLLKFVQLLNEHPKYIESYAHILMASDKPVVLASLIKANELWGMELTIKAMEVVAFKDSKEFKLDKLIESYEQLIAVHGKVKSIEEIQAYLKNSLLLVEARGWADANNYLQLITLNRQYIATAYLKDEQVLLYQPRINAILGKVETLIQKLEANSIGPKDEETTNYCVQMKKLVSTNKNDYLVLLNAFNNITKALKASTSPEMHAIKKEVSVLEGNARRFFGSPLSQEKANAIKAAVGKIPILERDNIFKSDSPQCKTIQKVLFSNGILVHKLDVNKLSMDENSEFASTKKSTK
jgi:hypothetical protein